MKRNLLILSLIFLFHSLAGQISREQAFEIIKTEVLAGNTDNVNIFASKTMLRANSIINTVCSGEIISPNITAWMFFIDDHPFQNWAHPARYAFVGNSGQVIIQPYGYPPLKDNLVVLIEKTIIISQENNLQKMLTAVQKNAQNSALREHQYAVIISGGINKDYNDERFWNECAAIYTALIHVFNYKKSNIYVLISDGTDPAIDRHRLNGRYDSSPLDLDGDGLPDTQYAATKSNIRTVFDTLSQILTNEDTLFIFSTDHGGSNKFNTATVMCLWNDEEITTYEFADEVNKVNAKVINIVMQQCFSGGFINDLAAENRVIATSCADKEYSWSLEPFEYCEFTYHWISAILSQTPRSVYEHANCKYVNADCNQDCFISMQEAFTYATTHDVFTTDPEQEEYETPQYFSQPENLGETLNLGYISTYFLTNQTVITNKDITMCGEINIQNVTISNDAIVNINSGEKIVINPNFHVATGTTVHITIGNPLECDALPQKSILFTNNKSHFEEPYLQNLATNITNFTNQTPNFQLYPNPNNGTFQIDANFPLTDIAHFKITNLMGVTVYETQNVASNMVQLQNPTAGTFFVVMVLKDGAVLTRKMVVQ